MNFRVCSALLLLLSACATSAPDPKAQVAVPVGPLVTPKPLVVPAPIGLTPPAPVMVVPEEEQPGSRPNESSDKEPVPALTSERRPECTPQLVPHLGGDALHNECADKVPQNSVSGFDVLVNGKRFDAMQPAASVLWEVKTDNFDTYTTNLQRIVIDRQVPELTRERDLARACGFSFRVGVRSAAHRAALLKQAPFLDSVVMDWC